MRTLSTVLALALGLSRLAGAAEESKEPQLPVMNKAEVTLKSRTDADVDKKELWYRRFEAKGWGEWQKHGLTYSRENAMVWAPPEGRLQTYVRVIELSGLANDVPTGDAKPVTEFIIDRTPPTVGVAWPTAKTKLRGGQPYTVKWTANDPNLAVNPIGIEWSRDGATFESLAENLPNTGSQQITIPRDMTPTAVLRITAKDKAANVGSGDATQLLIDAIAPTARVTGPAISAAHDLNLAIDARDAGPAGLSSVQLWVSADDGQSWVEGPAITEGYKQIAWKAPRDGAYRLALVATDQAGNVSPTPRAKAEDQFVVLVDTTKPVIQIASAVGITHSGAEDAKGNPRNFKPGDRVQLQFAVKEPNIAANSVTVALQTDPNKGWIELGKNLPADSAYRFEIPKIAEVRAECRVRVTATDVAGNIGEAVSTETFVIKTAVTAADPGLQENSGLE